ncbi:MAG: right-handed parallel beta-helix repeat-containing protein, partial [Thermoproteota archaeon]|nr:right-handed parallel beta-helix repeat-containing protein [Thermoproteota archaeon]
NLIPKVVGATLVAGFAWKHLKTRFKVDLPKIKVQTTRLATYSLLFMLCAGLFLFADVPVSEAATTATTGYILDTPVSEHAWLIGAYSDGTYYAINGGTWDNMVAGVGSTAWATYKTNSTALTAQVLAACTSGTIYMKDVAFDMNLFDDIHEGVRVICSYNAEYWEYINSADSSGSPYTVSVGSGVNVGYYLAADSEGRICFTSTNAATVINSALAKSGHILVNDGTYIITDTLTLKSNTLFEAQSWMTILKLDGVANTLLYPSGDSENITIRGFTLDGNRDSYSGTVYPHPIQLYTNINNVIIENNHIINSYSVGIDVGSGKNIFIKNNLIENSRHDGINLEYGIYGGTVISNVEIINNIIKNCDRYGILGWSAADVLINSNIISGMTGDFAAIHLERTSNSTISNNQIFDIAGLGIRVYSSNNSISGNLISNASGGIKIDGSVYGEGKYNILSNNQIIVTHSALHFVNANWTITSGSTLQGAYALYMGNVSYHNTFSACSSLLGRFTQYDETNDYNIYIGIQTGATYRPININGANDRVISSWNGTSWLS